MGSTKVRGNLVRFALSAGGYAVTAVILWWGFTSGNFKIPGGDGLVWDRVGDELRSGVSPYYAVTGTGGFYYAPPWAVLFALVSWLPPVIPALAIVTAEVASLRYIAGSWTRVGYMCWIPYVGVELPSMGFNLIMAAAIAAAIRDDPRGAVLLAFAKLSPVLAIRSWRRAVPVGLAILVVTLPVAWLWPEWVRLLAGTYGTNIAPGTQLLIPFVPRLAIALGLVATRRPWALAVGAVIAVPALYPVTCLGFLALASTPVPWRHEAGQPSAAASAVSTWIGRGSSVLGNVRAVFATIW